MPSPSIIQQTLQHWKDQWSPSKKIWSDFVKLREPQWCLSSKAAAEEGLTGSFAMIRLNDHRIVIDIEKVVEYKIGPYALQILAHEIGHHIYTPANLYDNAILQSRIRWGLGDLEDRAPMVANLYEDLLINDRLHRFQDLDMAIIFQKINIGNTFSKLWMLYMRSYEYLWKLKRGTLGTAKNLHSEEIDADASLVASLIRSYSKNWIEGGGRFATLLYPYLVEEEEYKKGRASLQRLLDAEEAGRGGGVIAGLTVLDLEGEAGAVDPRHEALEGMVGDQKDGKSKDQKSGYHTPNLKGGTGPKQQYMNPGIYIDLQRQLNPDIDAQQLINNYYREIALPHLIDFPMEEKSPIGFTSLEGTEDWDISDPMEEIDWLETAIHSPYIVPGFNTRKRVYGKDFDGESEQSPLDVYIGIDCSGSMTNPSRNFSWPVLAATIISLSAHRAGANVMACLSGEPGSYLETPGFEKSEDTVLTVLTSYLGTGYAYGINRLKKPFENPLEKKSHIIIVTDDDIFSMLDAERMKEPADHWGLMETALANAGGEGTIVLHSRREWKQEKVARLKEMGWRIFYVTNEEELLAFAADFAQEKY